MEGLKSLYKRNFGKEPDKMEEIPCSVSTRRYFRIFGGKESIIGTYSPDTKETISFTRFARHFRAAGINVPEVLDISDDLIYYLQEDLGDIRMHEMIVGRRHTTLDQPCKELYQRVIDQLVKMQYEGHKGLDYSIAVPRSDFDKQAILWDMYHFKYFFLKTSGLPYDEQLLEESFDTLAQEISTLPRDCFMFRDFQTRNIMIKDQKPYFIDFLGGRRGPQHYDLASILMESKAALSSDDQLKLFDYYLASASTYEKIDRVLFQENYKKIALIRLLQVIGAYGLRGLIEKKAVFLQSIPKGLENLGALLADCDRSMIPSYLYDLLLKVAELKDNYRSMPVPFDGLSISVYSFSYRKTLPDDLSGNGGGFVYDCRFMNNPGRCDEFKLLSGLDAPVIKYLSEDPEVPKFLASVKDQLMQAIESYQAQGYEHLMVSFGCTGGRHRSVYSARKIADWCRTLPGLRVLEIHREMGIES